MDSNKHLVVERVLGAAPEDNIIVGLVSRGYEVNGRVVRCVTAESQKPWLIPHDRALGCDLEVG